MTVVAPVMGTPPPTAPTPGTIADHVTCGADPGQSYALYLPSSYTAERAWPIVYCFDPGANGRFPVARFQQAAEFFGYIIAGSNNSRNGPREIFAVAADAMMRDTHQRFHLDNRRLYAAGFSGGARAACALAAAGKFAGVIACSGGFPDSTVPPQVAFAFLGSTGREDFNYSEMQRVDAALAAQHSPHRLLIFDGSHEWLPESLAMDALEWLELQAMRSGLRPKDDALIVALFRKRLQAVAGLKGDAEIYLGYLAAASDFAGLTDTSEPAGKASALKNSPPVRQYFKAEKTAQEEEERWLERLNDAIGNPDRYANLRETVREARRQSETSIAARRALNRVLVTFSQNGSFLMEEKNYTEAIKWLEVATIIRPESTGLHFELAHAYAFHGDKRKARESLQAAIARGFNDQERIGQLEKILAP